MDFTHTVIGAGAVGLAIASNLVKMSPKHKVLLIEKNEEYGQETSSRNSEVIHAGLYYPPDSLKTKMCIRGKEMIYERREAIPLKQCGKWVVAQNEQEMEYLHKLHYKARHLGVPTEFIPPNLAKVDEPAVTARCGVLNSPTTGIVSAHGLMDFLATEFQNGVAEGSLVLGTKVVDIQYLKGREIFEIQTTSRDADDDEDTEFIVKSKYVINSAGLYAPEITNMVLPKEEHIKAYYAKGNYFSYAGPNIHIDRLIYPCPTHGVASLGTHLTLDMGGQIRFGPDLEWVNSLYDGVYKVNEHNLNAAVDAVQQYIPLIRREYLHGSYTGIRPKLVGPGGEFQDFVVREEKEHAPGMISLLGIESPGLTSSMALGEYVSNMLSQ